jgi:TonB family protein
MKDKKILIIDFDEESLTSLSNMVHEEGFQAVTASDGLSGYEKYQADDFDLVILEPMLPKLHGFELCKKINQDPFKKAPIIVVTGIYREPSCKMEALQVYGASAYFTKPWNKDDLRAKMLQLLVQEKDSQTEKEAEPAVPTLSAAPEMEEVLTPKPVPREPKMNKDMDEIERELQAAVSSLVSPARKKDIKKKKEPEPDVDKEIEAMLKEAIGELGLEEKKKKKVETARPELKITPEVKPAAEPRAVKPEPILKTTSIPKPEPWPEKKEKIPIAKEIRERFPHEEKAGNNIPLSASRARLDTKKTPFGIDRTLLEIDKIPFDLDKAPAELEKVPLEAEKTPAEKKSAYFDEYTEPRKKKTTFLFIGGLVAVIFIASSATFYVLKSKRAKQPPREMVSSLQPTLPFEFSTRQNEIMASRAAREKESKPEPKKTPAKPAEQQPSDLVEQVQPVLPSETPPVQLHDQPELNLEPTPQSGESLTPVETRQPETVAQAPNPQPKASESAPPKTKEGDLVPIEEVDIGPVVVKKVEPKYPAFALSMGLEGVVTVNALIAENGDVIRTEILKGVKGGSILENAAEVALKQWKFEPAQKDGVKVKVWKSYPFNFKVNTPVKE